MACVERHKGKCLIYRRSAGTLKSMLYLDMEMCEIEMVFDEYRFETKIVYGFRPRGRALLSNSKSL